MLARLSRFALVLLPYPCLFDDDVHGPSKPILQTLLPAFHGTQEIATMKQLQKRLGITRELFKLFDGGSLSTSR